jgi:hypothetical protein
VKHPFLTPGLLALSAAALLLPSAAQAQMGGGSMGGGQGGRQSAPTQSGPTQNKTIGPRAGSQHDDTDGEPTTVQQRSEPVIAPPANPLEIPTEVKERIGTDADLSLSPPPAGDMHRSYFPVYEEQKGDYRFRALPPLWLEHTRGLPTPAHPASTAVDRQSLVMGFFYDRRSPETDADVLFPVFWHVRDGASHLTVLGPLAHREAPGGEHDNWLAPLVFEGRRKDDAGYFHSPLLLTTSHWSKEKAFHLTFNYFHDRKGTDVDWGFAPFAFGGDNGNLDGGRKKYTLVPFALYYHRETEIDSSSMTVAGPVLRQDGLKRSISDVLPLYFHIKGHPETGGVDEEHTTLFPLFHYGHKEDEHLFASALYLRRTTKSVDTMLTPFASYSTTRNGATRLRAIGPIVPLFWQYRDFDVHQSAIALLPFYFHSDSPRGVSFLTPLFGRFEEYGVSKTYWALPTLLISSDAHGWEGDFLPLAFFGRSDQSSHAVIAPILWDFATPKGRTTVVLPLHVRLADSTDDSITQVTGNTVYLQKRVAGGIDWQFHVVPLLSYGAMPHGHWWNFLFGLAGYSHESDGSETVRAFWLPIQVKGPDARTKAVGKRDKGTDALISHF